MKIKRTLTSRGWSLLAVVLVITSVILTTGCNNLENRTGSGSKLILTLISGKDLEGNSDSTVIFSDVLDEDKGIINDSATAEMTATLIDPGQINSTFYHDVIIDQVDVEYSRADGLNTPGVDIPYGFSQKVNARIRIGEISDVGFVIVQHVAKMESPLVELVNLGQEKVLKLEARCTFHGKDVGGFRVEPVVGSISVWCADFGDEG